ncbi:MAG TPA: hypothetical protein DGG95_06120 [Cytophagales bacterium]|jgi:hypothetical protein|nr:hypothetical protein [Cytophagales bacterium]
MTCETKQKNEISQDERDKIKRDIEVIVNRVVESYNSGKLLSEVFLDSKDFRYSIPGKILTLEQFKEMYKNFYGGVKTQFYRKLNGELSYADSDFAIYIFITAFDVEKSDGEKLSNPGYLTTFIFKKINGTWKIVGGHES